MNFPWKLYEQKILGVSCIGEQTYTFVYRRVLWNKYICVIIHDVDSDIPQRSISTIFLPASEMEDFALSKITNISLSRTTSGAYKLLCTLDYTEGSALYIFRSRDFYTWSKSSKMPGIDSRAILVSKFSHKAHDLLVWGKSSISYAFLVDDEVVYTPPAPLLSSQSAMFDSAGVEIIDVVYEGEHDQIFILYVTTYDKEGVPQYGIGGAVIDGGRLDKVVWRSDEPLVSLPYEDDVSFGGAAVHEGVLYLYFSRGSRSLEALPLKHPLKDIQEDRLLDVLTKHHANPIVAPISENDWEAEGTFNPAAVLDEDIVHMFYRAVSNDGRSFVGHAKSEDGKTFPKRGRTPAYSPRKSFEGAREKPQNPYTTFSGGGWGGCEDPKAVIIDDRLYLTYVAFNGTWPERTAISSISLKDFRKERWDRWSEPALLSPDIIGNKSACLLPEKVEGKYVIFHRVWPDILVDYVDDLDFSSDKKWLSCTPCVYPWSKDNVVVRRGEWPEIVNEVTPFTKESELIKSSYWKELTRESKRISSRPHHWDSHKVSMGASPVKTKEGWLAIYSAVDRKDFSRYKIGMMLLDLREPHKVLARSSRPVIIPDEWYENEGKAGIVYPGGLIVKDGEVMVYYGGGDKVACVAHAPLEGVLDSLLNDTEDSAFQMLTHKHSVSL